VPATMVTVVDPGDGGKAVRHLDPDCPELMRVGPSFVLGQMAATRAVRALTLRCRHCFAETERREAAGWERRVGREGSRRVQAPPPAAPAVPVPHGSDATARHLVTIARCPNLAACLDGGVPGHPCAAIVLNQWDGVSREERLGRWREAHQLPEPWDGHLETAPILFVSSNPSRWRGSGRTGSPTALIASAGEPCHTGYTTTTTRGRTARSEADLRSAAFTTSVGRTPSQR